LRRRATDGAGRWRLGAAAAIALGLLAAGCSGGGADRSTGAGGAITVAAASDLRFAFEELGETFERDTGTEVTFSFGSSGQLATQITNGAPFDLFASADVAFVREVVAAGRADGSTVATYAFGRLVVFSRSSGPGAVTTLAGLADPDVRSVSIANPEHAPYGVAAEQALRSAGVYDRVGPKLVLGENVSDTLRLVTSGNADAAIVARSLVIDEDEGRWALVDASAHEPLEQALVVTGFDPATTDAAQAFADLVSSPTGRAVLGRHGFLLPSEEED
jgi:molybdate transport system substrate-binding protein